MENEAMKARYCLNTFESDKGGICFVQMGESLPSGSLQHQWLGSEKL